MTRLIYAQVQASSFCRRVDWLMSNLVKDKFSRDKAQKMVGRFTVTCNLPKYFKGCRARNYFWDLLVLWGEWSKFFTRPYSSCARP